MQRRSRSPKKRHQQDDLVDVSLGNMVNAHRFDFTLNDQYYVINIKLLDDGQRLETSSNLQGRVVAKEGIVLEPDIYLPHKIFYFQYRIDELLKGNKNPKICVGLCREDFLVN